MAPRLVCLAADTYDSVKIRFDIRISLFAAAMLCMSILNAQKSPADSLLLETMISELKLSESQILTTDSIMRASSEKIAVIDKEIMRISRSSLSEAEKSNALAELRDKKKILKEEKETEILIHFTDQQKKDYSEKIKPVKPPVFHMGMNHDRSNCNVCIPK